MKPEIRQRLITVILPIVAGILLLAFLLVYAYRRLSSLEENVGQLKTELASTTTALFYKTAALSAGIAGLEQKSAGLSETLGAAEEKIKTAGKNIEAVGTRVGGFEETVGKISGTVSTLQKLSKTDPELLRKYSKVFFLSEHYVPERLAEISAEYVYSDRRTEQIHTAVWPRLKALLDAAKADNEKIYVKSAYRSFDEQGSLKSAYTVTYGAGTANQFSADQGYSEHQLGTTADFITTGLGGELSGFQETAAYRWLTENAHKYGFILSYPDGNAYYIFEPWHWRFVGMELAAFLHNGKKYFYDLDQRLIDEYLAKIFD